MKVSLSSKVFRLKDQAFKVTSDADLKGFYQLPTAADKFRLILANAIAISKIF
jgi:hypothetical protein